MADRFPYPELCSHRAGDEIELGPELARHLGQVLRARAGDAVVLFDGAGSEARVRIQEVDKRVVRARLETVTSCVRTPSRELELAFSPPKGNRIELLLETAIALGVRRFQPIHFERTPKSQRLHDLPARWERIAWAVAGQCGLDRLPEFAHAQPLGSYVRDRVTSFSGERWIAEADKEAPSPQTHEGSPALVVVGPEGDFTPAERGQLHEAGCGSLTLGSFVLRIEVAAVAAASLLLLPRPGTS